MINDLVISKLGGASKLLAEAKTIQETKKVVDIAISAEIFAKRQKLGEEAIAYATSIKVEALRQLGNMLKDTKRAGFRFDESNKKVPSSNKEPTLEELGLDKKTSSLAQQVADLSDEEVDKVKSGVRTLSSSISELKRNKNRQNSKEVNVSKGNSSVLYKGDILEVIKTLDKFELVVTDPPYGVTEYEWDQLDTSNWLDAIILHLQDKYNLFWFCSPRFAADIEMIFRTKGLPIQSRIVWHRRNMAMGSAAKNKFIDTWEMILHAGNKELNFPSEWSEAWFDVQTFAVPQTNFTDKKLHPTQKPEGLIQRLVEFGSYVGDHVLDPFAGGGTTGIVCPNDRECVLIEKEEEYVVVIEERLGIKRQ